MTLNELLETWSDWFTTRLPSVIAWLVDGFAKLTGLPGFGYGDLTFWQRLGEFTLGQAVFTFLILSWFVRWSYHEVDFKEMVEEMGLLWASLLVLVVGGGFYTGLYFLVAYLF